MPDYPILKTGDRGSNVLHLKALLHAKGLLPESDDNQFYAGTAETVKVYQATHLGPDGKFLIETEKPGVVGENTWKALEGAFDQKQGAPVPTLKQVPVSSTSPRKLFLNQLIKWYKAGVKEVPKGANADNGGVISQMEKFHGMSGQPWCAMAINYAHYLVFGKTPPWGKMARVCDIWDLAKSKGLTLPANSVICPGDIGVYISGGLKKNGYAVSSDGHIFTLTGGSSTRITSIDGNSDDRIRAADRARSYMVGIIRLWPAEKLDFNLAGYETGNASDR